jgi:hypothetical protein
VAANGAVTGWRRFRILFSCHPILFEQVRRHFNQPLREDIMPKYYSFLAILTLLLAAHAPALAHSNCSDGTSGLRLYITRHQIEDNMLKVCFAVDGNPAETLWYLSTFFQTNQTAIFPYMAQSTPDSPFVGDIGLLSMPSPILVLGPLPHIQVPATPVVNNGSELTHFIGEN